MNLWTFITVVSVVAIVAGVFNSWLQTKAGQQSSELDNKENQQQLETLEERIRVLEAIVTDDKYDLKREFADLHKEEVA